MDRRAFLQSGSIAAAAGATLANAVAPAAAAAELDMKPRRDNGGITLDRPTMSDGRFWTFI